MADPTEIKPTRLRPYSSPDQAGGESRSAAFSGGAAPVDPGNSAGVQSEVYNSEQYNVLVPHQWRPTSVLQNPMSNPGGNGMSAGDAARRTVDGQYLGSVNATSASSFEPAAMLRLTTGQDAI
jgi:hypothetical protein